MPDECLCHDIVCLCRDIAATLVCLQALLWLCCNIYAMSLMSAFCQIYRDKVYECRSFLGLHPCYEFVTIFLYCIPLEPLLRQSLLMW